MEVVQRDDLISRQEAISALDDEITITGASNAYVVRDYVQMVAQKLANLPSKVSEEFEWCYDCKEYDQKAHCCHRWTKVIRNTLEELKQGRPKGKWKRISGYCTPGGDPVWCCSECGKGIHVYGIEHAFYGADIASHQWLACPNCGSPMEGEEDNGTD